MTASRTAVSPSLTKPGHPSAESQNRMHSVHYPRWAVPSWIQCGVAAAGQCPGAPTIPTTGGARARRVGCMSGPDNGARRATAREASCMHLCVPGSSLTFLQVGGAQGAARYRRRWRRRASFSTSSVGSVNATGPARRPPVGSRHQQAPVTTGYRESDLHFLPQVFCTHRMQ